MLSHQYAETTERNEMPTLHDSQWAETEDASSLLSALTTLDDNAATERFLRDLCTRREIDEFVSRWAVVRKLAEGHSYRTIHDETGVSTATVTRINDWFRNGSGGYLEALQRLGIEPVQKP
ncbi:MAG: YerC/YecD family TrpR-related protein [Acidimicrobiia bacterium]